MADFRFLRAHFFLVHPVHKYPYSECAKVDDAVIAEAEHGEVQLGVGGAEVVGAGDPAAWQHEWP